MTTTPDSQNKLLSWNKDKLYADIFPLKDQEPNTTSNTTTSKYNIGRNVIFHVTSLTKYEKELTWVNSL